MELLEGKAMKKCLHGKNLIELMFLSLLVIFSVSACSFSLKSPETRMTETAMAMPTDTETPAPTKTVAPTVTDTPDPEMSFRWPAFPGSEYYIGDLDNNLEWDAKAQVHAKSLGVPKPYYYEFYILPPYTPVDEVDAYVAENCDEYRAFPGDKNIYLYRGLGEVDGVGEIGYNLQHWVDSDVIMILYFTPDDYFKSMVR
jgi:hypothetical protein